MTNHFPVFPGQPMVVFTDLDGTLLDHHTYQANEAAEALRLLEARGWPLVFCSSKTFSEQVFLQKELEVQGPFIFENGSAVAIPKGYFTAMLPAPMEREGFEIFPLAHGNFSEARLELIGFQGINGFSDVSDAELANATGLKEDDLTRARDRWFTETLVSPIDETQALELSKTIAKNGWLLSKGGRFYTIQSASADKGRAMLWLAEIFTKNRLAPPLLAALGDSPNDLPMLVAADFPFLVQRFDGDWADLNIPGLVKVEAVGPAGFLAAIRMMLGA
jgi:mannosyl-3-phosphoglycerate phosphatase